MVSYTEGDDEHIEENKKMGMADVFFIRFVEHPESRERNAYFIPVLKGQENQEKMSQVSLLMLSPIFNMLRQMRIRV